MHVHDAELRLYLMERLERNKMQSLESHLTGCGTCAGRISSVTFFDQLTGPTRAEAATFGGLEKRSERRISTVDAGILQCISPFSSERLDVRIIDVSKSGLKVGGANQLEPGSTVKVRLKSMIAFGEVRHCSRVGSEYQAGIQIHDALLI